MKKKHLVLIGLLSVAILVSGKSVNQREQKSENSIYEAEVEAKAVEQSYDEEIIEKTVALTFDDGPHAKNTQQILDILKEYNAKATFFITGISIEKNPDVVREIIEGGHEIGNHTSSHVILTKLNSADVQEEIVTLNKVLESEFGVSPRFVRPPGGETNETVLKVLEQNNMALAMWDVDSRDWQVRNAKKIAQNVLKNVQPGNVILMHDIHKTSIEAVRTIVSNLSEEGYQFITMSEMFPESTAGMIYPDKPWYVHL